MIPITKLPWFSDPKNLTAMVINLGPLVVAFFVFLYVIAAVLPNMRSDHEMIINGYNNINYKQELTNHFLWADCFNNTDMIEDLALRKLARERCQPPIEKRTGNEEQEYLNEKPSEYVRTAAAKTIVETQKSSSSSSTVADSPRSAEEIAEEQARAHRESLVRQGNTDIEVQ